MSTANPPQEQLNPESMPKSKADNLSSSPTQGSSASPLKVKRPFKLPRKSLLLILFIALALIVLTVPAIRKPVFSSFSSSGSKKNTTYITDQATRGPFRVTVTERGQLDSLNNVTLNSKVKGYTTILSIVPEGTMVKAGDLLCELDSAILVDKEKQQQIQVTQAEAELLQARENVAIQKTQNESDISAAELALELAELDLEKFQKGESQRDLNVKEGAITKAREDLQRAEENFGFSKRIAKKGYKNQNDVEADRITVVKAEIDLEIAKEDLKVEKEYVQKRKETELKAAVKENIRNLERVRRKGIATLAQFEAKFKASQLTYEVEKSEHERMLEQIEACKLIAPQNGQVVYANQSNSRRGNGENVIEEGSEVRERQAIIQLPDFTQMKVDARIHESKISLIRQNLTVDIRVDAFPDETYLGEVDQISSVPISSNWMRPDLKEYKASIKILPNGADITKLKPGLTAEIEIRIEERENVLQVPVQSVISIGDNRYIFVVSSDGTPARKTIQIGQASDTMIEILDGIGPGEEVILNPRTHFADELIDLEEQLALEKKKQAEKQPKGQSRPKSARKQAPGKSDNKTAGGASGFLKRFDKNSDNKISREEAPKQMQKVFASMDANKDGFLDAGELNKAKGQRPASPGQKPSGEKRP